MSRYSFDFRQTSLEDVGTLWMNAPAGAVVRDGEGLEVALKKGSALDQFGWAKAEVGPAGKKGYLKLPFRKQIHAYLQFRVPEDWTYKAKKAVVFEFHGTEDPEEKGIGRNASISTFLLRDRLVGWRLWSDKRVQTGNENRKKLFSVPFTAGNVLGITYRLCFDWRRDTKLGYTRWNIFSGVGNEVGVYKGIENGPNAYNDAAGPYCKFGLYLPDGPDDRRLVFEWFEMEVEE